MKESLAMSDKITMGSPLTATTDIGTRGHREDAMVPRSFYRSIAVVVGLASSLPMIMGCGAKENSTEQSEKGDLNEEANADVVSMVGGAIKFQTPNGWAESSDAKSQWYRQYRASHAVIDVHVEVRRSFDEAARRL